MTSLTCDVAIIGAGTAGLAAERAARLAGASTLLIDDQFAGTTCASVGCMPSKLLIAAAEAAHAVRRAPAFGIHVAPLSVDGTAVMRRVQEQRDQFVASAKTSLTKLPPGVQVQARARFADAATLLLNDGRQVRARAIVIATGARPSVPALFDAVKNAVLTNETLFDLLTLPQSVAVVGAGPLGLELAQALSRLGVEVRVFDESPRLSGIADRAIEVAFRAILKQELSTSLGVKVRPVAEGHGMRLHWSGAVEGSHLFERVLVATGRPPDFADLNLAAAGIELDEHRTPRYDAQTMQCGRSSIFVAGDADHDRPVLHEASAEGAIAGRNAAKFPDVARTKRFASLSMMFTDPQLAIVGEIPKPNAADSVTGSASYDDQGRAKVFARNAGLVHLYADTTRGRLQGAMLCGPAVEHSAHLIAWAVQQGLTASEVLLLPFYHPTYEEGLKPALRSICKSIDVSMEDLALPGE